MRFIIHILLWSYLGLWAMPATAVAAESESFEVWLDGVRKDALQRGVSTKTIEVALKDLRPIAQILELDRKQAEFTLTFWDYLHRTVTPERIKRGRTLLLKHRELFRHLQRTHGVPPRFLVAFWGLESNFGAHMGDFPVVASVATLAYDPRRSAFFRNELMQALFILEQGHISPDSMRGSWAGAMGQVQFMPSTFTAYAQDGNGDGKIDIWGSVPDAMTSAAHYLQKIGWQKGETWGREVKLPKGFDLNLAGLDTRKTVMEWRKLGVRRAGGGLLPKVDMRGSILLPAGHKGPVFLVYDNFRVIMRWNQSQLYALAIGHLADRLRGDGPLNAVPSRHSKGLNQEEIVALQKHLNQKGYNLGPADGVFGRRSRKALKAYQQANGLPPDAYPSKSVLNHLRGRDR